MTMESPVRYVGNIGGSKWLPNKESVARPPPSGSIAPHDLESLFKAHIFHGVGRDTVPSRSGSAPPSMEGSLSALANFYGSHESSLHGKMLSTNNNQVHVSEDQLRADPSYITYYLSNVNLNPRLPPPLITHENRHLAQQISRSWENGRLASFDENERRCFMSTQAPLSAHKEEAEEDRSTTADTNSGFLSREYPSSLEGQRKNMVDPIQENFPQIPSPLYNDQSRMSSHGSGEVVDSLDQGDPLPNSSITTAKLPELGVLAINSTHSMQSVESIRNPDLSANSVPSTSSSESRNIFSLNVKQKGGSNMERKSSVTDVAGSNVNKITSEMKNLNISNEQRNQHHPRQKFQQGSLYSWPRESVTQFHASQLNTVPQSHGTHFPSAVVKPASQSTGYPIPLYDGHSGYMNSENPIYPNVQQSSLFPPQYSMRDYAINTSNVTSLFSGYPPPGAIPMAVENPINLNINAFGRNVAPGADLQQLHKLSGQHGMSLQPSATEGLYLPYFQQPLFDAFGASSQYDIMMHNYEQQSGPLIASYSSDQNSPHLRSGVSISSHVKGGVSSPSYYGNPQNLGLSMQYPSSSFASPHLLGLPIPENSFPVRQNENIRLPVTYSKNTRSFSGGKGQKVHERINTTKKYPFLDELQSSKAQRFELSDIVGHIAEYSTDQYGSRCIQQKLENCSDEEKAHIFHEIIPRASMLMTDVFGNYVIQKFFEHGNAEQRKVLANRLVGHILPLSLQMYGCRVIQKALEVIEPDQKTQLVQELDTHVMRCVKDQNGNHVIQKCIECVPTENIQFIISAFKGHVAKLSLHPYGCRVIQRLLEHWTNKLQSQFIVDEILQSACILAQDQYGNYVTQHVLERGKPEERNQIITELAGQIVQMSQNKYASNVIEKCLVHGGSLEKELLIKEIVGQTEGNENLLVMMKDQYANYVIQKILETCSNRQRAILLSHVEVHLPALKNYTYGKHIVARIEQLYNEDSQ